MKASMLIAAVLLASGSVRAAGLETCDVKKNYGSACTRERVAAADTNRDGVLDKKELDEFIRKGDFAYSEAITTVKRVAPNVDMSPLLDYALEDYYLASCGDEFTDCPGPYSINSVARTAVSRNRSWKPVAKAPFAFKATRKATDVDPRGGQDIKSRPFVVSYKQDDIKREEGLLVLGLLSGPSWCEDRSRRSGRAQIDCGPTLELDVDTASGSRGSNNSDITFGISADLIFTPSESDGVTHRLQLTPSWLTDADFGRDVLLLSATYSLFTPKFGGPGYHKCIGSSQCHAGAWEWTWLPSLVLQAGDIRDPSGNVALEKRAQDGAYVRLSPTIGWRIYSWDRRHTFGLDLSYAQDLDTGLGRGYGELSYLYDFTQNVGFTIIFRRGYKVKTFEEVDSVVVGVGFSF